MAAALCSLSLSLPSLAHPEIEEQLAHVTSEIASSPDSAKLYLKRGQLYRVHREWTEALADFQQSAKLDPKLHRAERAIGRLHLEADKPKRALSHLDQFLEQEPGDPDGLILRGRAQAKLGDPLKAATDFDSALPKLRRPTPGLYIERAEILIAAGEPYRERALEGLAEGIEKLGDLYTLQRFAADLEIDSGRHDAALKRAQQLLSKSNGDVSWQIFEAELLVTLDRTDEARAAYGKALAKITSLPPHRRRTKAVADTEKAARAALAELGAGS
jgi:predicted Zn-dependent protease